MSTTKTKRVGKPNGVTDKDVIVAQKRAEKEKAAEQENNPLRQVYREGTMVTITKEQMTYAVNGIRLLRKENARIGNILNQENIDALDNFVSYTLMNNSSSENYTAKATVFRDALNRLLYLQEENVSEVMSFDKGNVEGTGMFTYRLVDTTPLEVLVRTFFEVHTAEIAAGNTVDVDVLRAELVEKQNQVAPKLEVVQD